MVMLYAWVPRNTLSSEKPSTALAPETPLAQKSTQKGSGCTPIESGFHINPLKLPSTANFVVTCLTEMALLRWLRHAPSV